jgi:hypothetical protein
MVPIRRESMYPSEYVVRPAGKAARVPKFVPVGKRNGLDASYLEYLVAVNRIRAAAKKKPVRALGAAGPLVAGKKKHSTPDTNISNLIASANNGLNTEGRVELMELLKELREAKHPNAARIRAEAQ